jgi:hypothetical protein
VAVWRIESPTPTHASRRVAGLELPATAAPESHGALHGQFFSQDFPAY